MYALVASVGEPDRSPAALPRCGRFDKLLPITGFLLESPSPHFGGAIFVNLRGRYWPLIVAGARREALCLPQQSFLLW